MIKEKKKNGFEDIMEMEDINLLRLKHLGINLLKHWIVDTCNNLFSHFSASDRNEITLRTMLCFKISSGVRFKVKHSNPFDSIMKRKNKSMVSQSSYAIP